MKNIFLVAALIYSMAATSQVTRVNLQASGLTCSMCSNAINKALKSLDFVEKVETNIKTSTFEIFFKPNSKVDFDRLKSKVEGAGFSVADFKATIQFANVKIKSDEAVVVGDKKLRFVNVKEQVLNGPKTVKVVDRGFVSAKESKKIGSLPATGNKIYNVTI